jgi:hypothetical protein
LDLAGQREQRLGLPKTYKPSLIDYMSPEERAAYLKRTAYGSKTTRMTPEEKLTGSLALETSKKFLDSRVSIDEKGEPDYLNPPPITGPAIDSALAVGQRVLGRGTGTAPVWKQWGYTSVEEALTQLEQRYREGKVDQATYNQYRRMLEGQ